VQGSGGKEDTQNDKNTISMDTPHTPKKKKKKKTKANRNATEEEHTKI